MKLLLRPLILLTILFAGAVLQLTTGMKTSYATDKVAATEVPAFQTVPASSIGLLLQITAKASYSTGAPVIVQYHVRNLSLKAFHYQPYNNLLPINFFVYDARNQNIEMSPEESRDTYVAYASFEPNADRVGMTDLRKLFRLPAGVYTIIGFLDITDPENTPSALSNKVVVTLQ